MRRLNLIASLEAIPLETAKARDQIKAIEARVEEGRRALQALQVQRRELETKATAAQEQVMRYRTQQLQVKKNEEYRALNLEIETTQTAIGALEDEELALLLQIDDEQQRWERSSADAREEIALLEKELANLAERERNLAAERGTAEAAAEEARGKVLPAYLEAYGRVGMRKAKQPWVVMLEERRCGGCHLRVSGEVESAAREVERPVHCDNCGRIVYWD